MSSAGALMRMGNTLPTPLETLNYGLFYEIRPIPGAGQRFRGDH